MKREFLRGLGVDEEHIPKILDEHHDSLKEYKESASKVEELNEKLKTANEEISNRDQQIEDLKASTDSEELQKQLDEYKANNEKYAEKLKEVNRNNALKLKAVQAGARNPDAVIKLFDMDKLELDDEGNPKNLDDTFEEFAKSEDYLFEPAKKTGRTPQDGDPPAVMSKSEILKIQDPAERQKAIKENMNLFN